MGIKSIIQYSIDYIDENIKDKFSVADLCNHAGYSYEHYCRLFKQYVGLAPAEYIIRRKLLYAIYDISQGKSKTTTAFEYGYDSYAGFYKAFMREYKCSPSEFIKNYKGSKPYKMNILQEEHIMISKDKIKNVLKEWNIENAEINNIFNKNTGKQSENTFYIGSTYVIKYTNNIGFIKNNISITNALIYAGLPASEVINTVKGESYYQSGDLYFILQKRIIGEQLSCDDIFNDMSLAFQIGQNIAKLHTALLDFDKSNYDEKNVYNEVLSIMPCLIEKGILTEDFVNDYKETFGAIYDELPKQIIHRDINPSNMIFDNGVFKGFLDFDLSEYNIRIFDICYCATSILSESYLKDVNLNEWRKILNAVIDGYESITPLNSSEKSAIKYVIYSIQIICINYFSKLDKYEELSKINIDILNHMLK